MDVSIEVPDFGLLMREIEGGVAESATDAMRETTLPALMELREQVASNGLGQRLANTWRDRVYPEQRESMTPTGYIWSNAPDIIDSFLRGATIRPVGGAKYLWIPTKNVPLVRARVNSRGRNIKGGAMSPPEVESMFNADFQIRKGRAGTLLAFIDVVRAKNMRAFRRATKGRAAQGRTAKPVLMFVLRRTVRLPKLLDLQGPAQRWESRFADAFSRRMAA
jgi:hypothetical protein